MDDFTVAGATYNEYLGYQDKRTSPLYSSKTHLDIADMLDKLYYWKNIKNEFFVEAYFLDILWDEKKKIAIEVDGPTHDLSSLKEQFKIKILSKLGWTIYHINYKEWDSLNSNVDKKLYLMKRFTAVV